MSTAFDPKRTTCAWRLMWHQGPIETDTLAGSPVSFVSDEASSEAEARAMVRQLKAEGVNCISVTATNAGTILRGTKLKRWLAMGER